MIRIGQFDYNPVKGTMQHHCEPEKTTDEIFREVKRVRHDLIRVHSITDEELKGIIKRIKSGTRNTLYLAPDRRLKDIATHIVREYT